MTEDMSIESYLAQGGVLTNPTNVPSRYRAELMKLMTTFVDSELAGAAGFADVINAGPGIKERIAAAKIVLEKTDNADRVLKVMGEFGVDAVCCAGEGELPWLFQALLTVAKGRAGQVGFVVEVVLCRRLDAYPLSAFDALDHLS